MGVTFTDEQRRIVNTYYPGLGVIPPNVGSGGLLGIIATAVDAAIAAGPTAAAAAAQSDIDDHVADASGAHADTAISYTRADGSKKNIDAASDTVGAAINDLDDKTGALSGLTTTDKTSVVAAINEVRASVPSLANRFVVAAIAVPDVGGGGTDAALTLALTDKLTGAPLTAAVQVLIVATSGVDAYRPHTGSPDVNSITFSAATTGTLVASGPGWALVQTSATGTFACTVANTDDEAINFKCVTAEGVGTPGTGALVIESNVDSATWSA